MSKKQTNEFLGILAPLKRSERAQDKVMKGYIERFKLSKAESGNLHMFFSPNRVPLGLTEGEIRLAILLHSMVRDGVRAANKNVGYSHQMTRSGFLKMIREVIRQLDLGLGSSFL